MVRINDKEKVVLIGVLVLGITYLHYDTRLSLYHNHIFYRQLYFLPVVLAGFWFGLKSALITSSSITALYLPFIYTHWQNFSPDDFDQLLELVLYFLAAIIPGSLREREWAEQKRLREAESLAAMGKAIAGVAHDVKTPLVAIGGFSRLVQRRFSKGDPDYQRLGIVIRETGRLEDMMKDLLDFARPLELYRCCEDLNEMVRESLSIVEDVALGKGIKIEHDLAQYLPAVALDSMRMERALINLVVNAIQASPDGEAVTVRTYCKGEHIVVDVSDRGCGIPLEQRKEIFTPFFTTKKEGTGLGLCIVKKIVEAHNGSVTVLDSYERGATFRVALPVDSRKALVSLNTARSSDRLQRQRSGIHGAKGLQT